MSISQNYPTIAPSLSLDFANVKKLDPRITFARASTGAYYDGQTVAKAEENLLLQSQTFDNAYWTKTNITVTANSTTAPDGTTTAESILETATTGAHQVFRDLTQLSGTYVTSIFAKANGRNWLAINTNFASVQRISFFDLENGVVGSVPVGFTASIVDVGDGWYRCVVVGPRGINAYPGIFIIALSDGDPTVPPSYAGDITKGLFLWGAQFEQRSAVTAYTPTTTQPITNYIPALQTAASGVARFDHDPVTTESLGLLIEEQRTNLLTYSEDFTDGSWVKSTTTITSNTITAPDGTLTGDKLVETSGAGLRQLYKTPSLSAVSHSFSAYFKASERYWFKLNLTGSGAYFDLSTGVIGTIDAGVTAAMTAVGNGWYRCSIVRTVSAGTNYTEIQLALTNGGGSYTGDGTSGIFIWGAQLEAGAFPTSYIPTVASQVTRAADSASMTGANLFSWFNPSQGTLYAEANHIVGVNQNAYFAQIAGTGSGTGYGESIAVGKFDSSAIGSGQRIKGIVYVINSIDANLVTASNITTSPVKVSLGYKVNDFAASIDGAASLTDTSGVLPVINSVGVFSIGSIRGGGLYINSTIKKIAYFPARLSNEQLEALTS
jgi:hypothetical protein